MKVVRYDNNKVKLCNVQVRDLIYISRKYQLDSVMNLYVSYINRGIVDTDFVSITDPKLISVILNDDGIVELSSYVNCDVATLSRMIVLGSTSGVSETSEHRKEDLSDLIDFNRGSLSYTIPLFVDGMMVKESKDQKFVCYSTCFPNVFLIRKRDVHAQFSINMGGFYDECIESIYQRPAFRNLERDVHLRTYHDYMIIKVNTEHKKTITTRIKENVKKLTKKKED